MCVCGGGEGVCVCSTSFLSTPTSHTPTTLSSLEDTNLPCLAENARAFTTSLEEGGRK